MCVRVYEEKVSACAQVQVRRETETLRGRDRDRDKEKETERMEKGGMNRDSVMSALAWWMQS